MNISVQQFMEKWRNEQQNKARNYVSPNNLNYFLDGVIACSPKEKLNIEYYLTDYNELPEPYYSKVLLFCQSKGYTTLLKYYNLNEVFIESINMDIHQVKSLIDKRNEIRKKIESIDKDFQYIPSKL